MKLYTYYGRMDSFAVAIANNVDEAFEAMKDEFPCMYLKDQDKECIEEYEIKNGLCVGSYGDI